MRKREETGNKRARGTITLTDALTHDPFEFKSTVASIDVKQEQRHLTLLSVALYQCSMP